MEKCSANCTFTYWSVIPPTHCPYCGRCLGCGAPAPAPRPWPRPYGPTWTTPTPNVTITSVNTPSGGYHVSRSGPPQEVYL